MRAGKLNDMMNPPPRLRRAYYDCRYGQLHVHNAIPAGGGFDELTPVICLHGTGQTGRVFVPLLHALGYQRSVYALDLPGCGESDPANGVDGVESATHAVTDFVDSMRIRSYDLLARAEGCVTALRVIEQRGSAVRRAILLGGSEVGARSGSKVSCLPLSEADSATFGPKLVEILAVRT